MTDQPIALTPVGGGAYQFDSTQRVAVLMGQFDYNGDLGYGSVNLAGSTSQNSAMAGTLQDFGDGTFGLIVPVDFTIYDSLGLTIRATGSFSGLFVPRVPGSR